MRRGSVGWRERGDRRCHKLPVLTRQGMVDQSDTNLEEILTFVILDLEHQEDQEREQVDAQ